MKIFLFNTVVGPSDFNVNAALDFVKVIVAPDLVEARKMLGEQILGECAGPNLAIIAADIAVMDYREIDVEKYDPTLTTEQNVEKTLKGMSK